jgi:hypothetical protein
LLGLHSAQESTPFHSNSVPSVSILVYYVTVSINAGLQDEQALAVLVLVERLCNSASQKEQPLVINSLTVHR